MKGYMFIDAATVKQRDKAGISLSYLEGHQVIQQLNELPDKWSFHIKSLEQLYVPRETTNKAGKVGHECGYQCIGRLVVGAQTFEDVGYGMGTSYNTIADACESAGKEAVTDALKRCAKNLGNYFGLALYDKDQEAVLPFDEKGWNKLYNLASKYADSDTQKAMNAIKDEVKNRFNIAMPSDMKPYMWREVLQRCWQIYWNSFTTIKGENVDARA